MPHTSSTFLLIVAFASALSAADPYVGTWKMNVAKSKFRGSAPPREQIGIITDVGPNLHHKVTGMAADGSKISSTFTIPSASGPGKVLEASFFDSVSVKRFSPNEREVTYMKGGKVINTVHSRISTDGKSMSVHSKGVNPQGQPTENDTVYEKVIKSE